MLLNDPLLTTPLLGGGPSSAAPELTVADGLWAATIADHDAPFLLSLTNTRDRSRTERDDDVGLRAAQKAINLWPYYVQREYNPDDPREVDAAIYVVIAILRRRGGTTDEAANTYWDEVFGPGGILEKIKNTGPRAGIVPTRGNRRRTADGRPIYAWHTRGCVPHGLLPRDCTDDDPARW